MALQFLPARDLAAVLAPVSRTARAVCHSPGVEESPWICCIQIPVRQPSARCTDSVSQKDSTGQR